MSSRTLSRWSPTEEKAFRKLSTPDRIQFFLDAVPYRCEGVQLPAVRVLRDNQAHCFDGALLAAAALKRSGLKPFIIDLCSVRDDDHLLCAFRWKKHWGAVAKSNFPGLRFREPVFKSPRELVMSYFELFFNLRKQKNLREYSDPFPLPSLTVLDWECNPRSIQHFLKNLSQIRHHRILLPDHEKTLRKVDDRLFASQMVGVNMKGAYGGKV